MTREYERVAEKIALLLNKHGISANAIRVDAERAAQITRAGWRLHTGHGVMLTNELHSHLTPATVYSITEDVIKHVLSKSQVRLRAYTIGDTEKDSSTIHIYLD